MKFANYHTRNEVYRARRKLRDANVDNDNAAQSIYINENLTKKRAELFWTVKKAKHTFIDRIWTQDGKIIVKNHSGDRVTITRRSDLANIQSLNTGT